MAEIGPVIISAGGGGTRIRPMMNSIGLPPDYPKHLLPVGSPGGETLLGRIVRQASADPINTPPVVYTTESGKKHMQAHPDIGPVEYRTDQFVFSMDPLYYQLRRTGARVIGCAGDFYSDFTWADYLAAHEQRGLPMSVLASSAAGSKEAAVFEIENGRITGFSRPPISGPDDYRNVGAYIIDPDPEILTVMNDLLPELPEMAPADDTIFSRMVSLGLVGAITDIGTRHFNINSELEYEAMLAALSDYAGARAS